MSETLTPPPNQDIEILKDPDVLLPDALSTLQPDAMEDASSGLIPLPPILTITGDLPALTAFAAPNVKFAREIHPGDTGDDVRAHKRALSRWNPKVYPWTDFTDYAGEYFFSGYLLFKKQRGLGNAHVVGARTHEAMERTHKHGSKSEWAFDKFAISLASGYYERVTKTPEERIREAIVQAGFFWYGKRYNISYSQYRPMSLGYPPWFPTRWDCSGFYTACCRAGKAADPNGRNYDGLGYTGTLMSRGTRVRSIRDLQPGDPIFYGSSRGMPGFSSGDPTHVALYVGYRNGAHMVLTLGSYPMKYVPYSYRHDINHYRTYDFG